MNVECHSTCKEKLLTYLKPHSLDNCPLLDSSKVIMQCIKPSDTIQGRTASDVRVVLDCSMFIYFRMPIHGNINRGPYQAILVQV
jgi:hypothetical protein